MANNKINYKEYEINGKTVKLPIIDENIMTAKMRRETRQFSEERAGEEIFWLIVEAHLTEEELDVIDNLSLDELAELMGLMNDEDNLEKK